MKNIIFGLFLSILLLSSNAWADKDLKNVEKFIANIGSEIIKISQDEKVSGAKKSDKIIKIIDDSIDPNWISRFVLGINYRSASTKQKERFRMLYREFMVNTYGPKFKNYKGQAFEVVEVIKKRRFFLAKTKFITNIDDPAILIDFRIRKNKQDKLVVLDFIAEGISLIETQRSEFNSAISKKGLDSFLDDLEKRVEKLKKQNEAS